VEKALVGGIEAVPESVSGNSAAIVRRVSILEPVWQKEVENLLFGRAIEIDGSGAEGGGQAGRSHRNAQRESAGEIPPLRHPLLSLT
jgi:hypothetical protein